MSVTATMEYRDYVGLWEIAVAFCDIRFHGDLSDTWDLERAWNSVQYSEYDKYESLANEQRKIIGELEFEAAATDKEIDALVFPLRFWQYKAHRELVEKRRELSIEIENAKEVLGELKSKRFKNIYTLKREGKDFLVQHGFVPKMTTYNDHQNIITETWVRP